MSQINRGLIVLPNWGSLILKSLKTWEIRYNNTKIRGRIGIILSKTGYIFGEVDLVNSIKLDKELFESNFDKHRLNCKYEDLPDNYRYAWVLENPVIYDTPIKYNHPRGAIIWVKLD